MHCIALQTALIRGKSKNVTFQTVFLIFLSIQSNVLKVFFLFPHVTVRGDWLPFINVYIAFFALIAMTNSFVKLLKWLVDFSHGREVAFLTEP